MPNDGHLDLVSGLMATNDLFRIRLYGKDDDGKVEIATGDGGNEPIYVRQYYMDNIAHEACLLDTNGNTSFPGIITASSFNGIATSSNKINSIGKQSKADSESNMVTGLSITECYENGYPTNYGNIINIKSSYNGISQLLCKWIGVNEGDKDMQPPLYYRNKSDNRTDFSKWFQLAFIDDITPQRSGGIVAQSLGANGYVKFANGLILQWGYVNANYSASVDIGDGYHRITANTPIAFSRLPYFGAASFQASTRTYQANVFSSSTLGTLDIIYSESGTYDIQYFVIGE